MLDKQVLNAIVLVFSLYGSLVVTLPYVIYLMKLVTFSLPIKKLDEVYLTRSLTKIVIFEGVLVLLISLGFGYLFSSIMFPILYSFFKLSVVIITSVLDLDRNKGVVIGDGKTLTRFYKGQVVSVEGKIYPFNWLKLF